MKFSLLHARQREAVHKLVHSRGGIVWWKVGEGKTRISLGIFARLQKIYNWSLPSVCLIVCKRSAFYDWREEINRCFPNHPVYENDIPVFPLGPTPVFLLVGNGSLSRKRSIFASLQANKLIRFVVLDELWLYANKDSERSRCAYLLTRGRISVGLSGTIMKARDTSEVFCQAMAVQKHRYLAPSLTKFRTMHQRSAWQDGAAFPRKYPRKGSYKKIMRDLSEVTDVHFPEGKRIITEQFHTIPATPKQTQYFDELKRYYAIDELSLEFDHAIVISVKAQQIANGWVKNQGGEILHVDTNKLSKLSDEISDIVASGQKVVVWCAFRYDVTYLTKRLEFASVQMVGGKEFDHHRWRDPNVRVCLATEDSGASINHFTNTSYAIYYSANYKWLSMQQSRGRTDRGRASKHSECFYKYLQVEGSMDAHVYRTALASGRDEKKLIVNGVQNWLRK